MRAYSLDLRTHLLDAIAQGIDPHEAARVFGVRRCTILRYQQQLAASGSLAAKPIPGRPRQISPAQAPPLEAQLRAHCDVTLVAHCQRWSETQQVTLSTATMSRAIARLGWTWGEKAGGQPTRRARAAAVACGRGRARRPAVRLRRRVQRQHHRDAALRLGAPAGTHPRTGPRNYPHNLTLVEALTPTGPQAPVMLPSALNGDGFAASLAQVLVPTLQPRQIVILDKLSGHKPRR